MTRRTWYIAAAFFLVCVAFSIWSVRRIIPITRPNLIIISLDTLRADRLGTYGNTRDTSRNLDEFAETGAVFEQAMSVSSWTLPAHASMLSGVYPDVHGAILEEGTKIDPQVPFLPEILKKHGYRTYG